MGTLQNKTISGIFWSMIQNVGGKAISLLVTIILARLLSPSDFGLIGMLAVLIQLSQVMVNAGFNQALIQRQSITQEDYSSVFYLNLVVSLGIYLLLFFLAPSVASFYGQPQLINITRVLTLIFVINAFSYVQETKLTKEMQFKKLLKISLPSTVIGGMLSIAMAYLGYGVWSIVAMQLITRLAFAVQIWIYSKWKPLMKFSFSGLRDLFSFGWKIMLSSLIQVIYQNIYLVILGRFFQVAAVGYYQNANNLVQTPSATISGAVSKVSFSVLSSIQNNSQALKEGYKKIVQQLVFWILPLFLFAALLAEPLFQLLFTEKWLPAVPYFRWLCIVGVLFPLNAFNLNIVNVKGRSDLYLKLEIVKKVIITIGLIVVIPFGVKGLLVFQAANSVLAYFINSFYSGRFINYHVLEQLRDITPMLVIAMVSGGGVYFIDVFFEASIPIIQVMVGFLVGFLIYLGVAAMINLAPLMVFMEIVQSRVKSKILK